VEFFGPVVNIVHLRMELVGAGENGSGLRAYAVNLCVLVAFGSFGLSR
jgi:hypothetical protein